ncbi:IniB N-terminal domain-containing protein [Actinophytocola sp.]|uniref:IniB N-terminal domain-containing protein n=1 Tax=Actinophytocola sp. TaxID=1872138 RepID=UPI002ED7C8E0
MTYSFQTLQDFVLNLLNDNVAAAAYQADPVGALSDAGLGDLTPQDVQEVIPLVTDALPSEIPLGDFSADATGAMDGTDAFGGASASSTNIGDAGGMTSYNSDGLDLVAGFSSTANGVAGVVHANGDGFAEGSLVTPLGYVGGDTTGDYLIATAAPSDVLGNLGDTGDAVAGTVAHYVGTGADTLAGGVETGADTLAGFLAGPAAPVAGAVETGGHALSDGIETGADTVTGQLHNLPSTDSLPVDLSAVVPDQPLTPTLSGNVTEPHLGDLTGALPVALPDTSAVTDLLAHNPVTDAVSASPVGGLTDTVSGVTDHLPVSGLTDHLDLGL